MITLKNLKPKRQGDILLDDMIQRAHASSKNYTIGEIQDLFDWLGFNIKEGYIDEEIAEELLETKNYKEIERLRDMADMYSNINEI